MTTYVLDASAVIRFFDKEAGGLRVFAILKDCEAGDAKAYISAVQWGEVVGNLYKRFGPQNESSLMDVLPLSGVEVVSTDGEQAARAARLKVDRGIAYADAFALDVAMRSADHVLVTADYGFKAVDDLARIEFLPVK